jgi:hypothetical protein
MRAIWEGSRVARERSDGGTRGRKGGQFGEGCGGVEAGLAVAGLECFLGGAMECVKRNEIS